MKVTEPFCGVFLCVVYLEEIFNMLCMYLCSSCLQ